MTRSFELTVNGEHVTVETDPGDSLLHVLRNELDLRGTRFGCGLGQCGACLVLIDSAVVPSCDTPMWSAAGKTVVTIEGLGGDGGLHRVQQAILDGQAAQCAFCISGIAVNAAALVDANPKPSEEEIAEALDRNLCRCGVQRRVIQAILAEVRR